ncbi:DUF6054 family protein [Clostridium hydrogeniformans]|uniref:DUF6054 family protein n=1 Tax=Clostridium hydrogeniformans TaxID=349933 RepID=UPI0004848AD6|nr:DUF6054 family protein [Clostridium hydrogeniformans]
MAEKIIKVSISPSIAQEIVEKNIGADLVYSEINRIDGNIEYGVSIFEKYFFRASNRAALTVIFNNVNGETLVKAIATGSSQGVIFNMDWGAADDFAYSAIECLEKYSY